MDGLKGELEDLRLAVARLEAEVQALRSAAARESAQDGAGGDGEGGDGEGGGYDPWIRCYGGGSEEMVFPYRIKRFGNDVCVCLTGGDLYVDGTLVSVGNSGTGHADGNATYLVVGTTADAMNVYLNVTKTESACSAVLASGFSPSATWSICVGYCPAQSTGGRPMNFVVGTLVLNTGGGSMESTTEDVVTNVEYSTSDRRLTQTKKQITILAKQTGATTTVFTASPHSAEHATGGGS